MGSHNGGSFLVFLGVILSSLAVARASDVSGEVVIDHEGLQRRALLHVPAACRDGDPVSLVVALHGGGGNAEQARKQFGFDVLADRYKFIVAYPQGVEKHWNDGRGLRRNRAQRENIDDVGFIELLITRLAAKYPVDTSRVYLAGISNGAMLSFRFACEAKRPPAAIAAVVGNMPQALVESGPPRHVVPAMIICGTDDPLMPFEGGQVRFGLLRLGKVASYARSVRFWVEANHCSTEAEISWIADRDPDDGVRARVETYASGREGAEVVGYTLDGGGHTWPGGRHYLPRFMVGTVCRDFQAEVNIWEFFQRHHRD